MSRSLLHYDVEDKSGLNSALRSIMNTCPDYSEYIFNLICLSLQRFRTDFSEGKITGRVSLDGGNGERREGMKT